MGVNTLFCEIEKDFHRFSRSGDGLFHDVDDVVDADGKSEIEVLAAARRANASVKFGNEKPVDVKFVVLHHNFAGKSPVAFAANAAIFVQGRVELESTANEARRTTAGEIVLLDKQRLFACRSKGESRGQSARACSDDDGIVFTAIIVPPYNNYGFSVTSIEKERGTMDGKAEKKKYYLMHKKIYSQRFSTDCFSDYFNDLAKNTKIGLNDYMASFIHAEIRKTVSI